MPNRGIRLIAVILIALPLVAAGADGNDRPPAGHDVSQPTDITPATPQPDPQRLHAIGDLEVRFKPAVFSGDAFPSCDFDHPDTAARLLGHYTLKPRFFDADHNPVEKPTRPGRYGAIVAIENDTRLSIPPRLVTLFKQAAPIAWEQANLATGITLPPQAGVNAAVIKEQQDALGSSIQSILTERFLADTDTPLLLAAMSEVKPGGPKLAGLNSIWARDQRWWYPLKEKMGRTDYPCLIDLPPDYALNPGQRYPLLLFLHGSGERGSDTKRVRKHGPPSLVKEGRRFPFVLLSPQCPAGEWWSARQLVNLIQRVEQEYRIDADRIWVTGLSMGGYGTWELAAEYPESFAAIVPICGAGSTEDVDRLKTLPAWVFHGQRDPAVPSRYSIEMVDALKKAGANVTFTLYPDLGHDCWTATYANDALYAWLMKQHRAP